ncbi:DNA methyltransferase [Massilia rubra]|uniref:Site-specific DNA-methyltransferase n=1 Tax=Massilia rubra TaxID=2607910 RepID=A0ABX0LIQ1_9BURK|nr:DNA methyltransferase [Massilia rubra]NHZ34463.1 site-specific DNA-methyltransferase [Massilia rubra]
MRIWNEFKDAMPHQALPYSKRNWGSPLHSVCSYQAKMKPALAHHLVGAFSKENDVILDPFSGSGTIPFEASLMGRVGLGLDIALLGVALSNAKLMRPDAEKVKYLLDELAKWIKTVPPSQKTLDDAGTVQFNGKLSEYFHPETYMEVLSAREFFAKNKADTAEWHLVMSCMLHILHGNRPYALSRNSHPITPYAPTGEYIYKSVVEKLSTKVNKSLAVEIPSNFKPGRCYQADICEPWPEQITQVDAIITSPPFFDSTRFYMTNWMRYWFCGWARSDFDTESQNFVEVTQKKNLSIYLTIFDQFSKHLKDDGLVVLHLGFSKKCDMATELALLAEDKFSILDRYTESVDHCESHGIRDKGSVTGHQYLVLKKK